MGNGFFGLFGTSTDKEPVKRELVVHKNRCPQNHPCPAIRVCPSGALKQKGFAAPTVDKKKCTNCGKCARYCAYRALHMEPAAK